MCEKCAKEPSRRNTRYCDDWWDDIEHGGYKADKELKEKQRCRSDESEAPRYSGS